MAKFTMGYMGPFSGRLGTAVGYMWNGKCCLRSYQRYVRNPRTEAQQAHRTLFKQEVQLAARMRWAVATTMTDLAREAGMTAYNVFVKANQHAFALEDNELVVDYSSLRLSIGDVQGVVQESVEVSDDNILTVSFARGTGRAYDRVFLYVYVPELGKGYLAAPVYRRDRRVTVALPDEFSEYSLQAWLMVQAEDGRWSESTYVAPSAASAVPSWRGVAAEGGRGVSHCASPQAPLSATPIAIASETHPAPAGHPSPRGDG